MSKYVVLFSVFCFLITGAASAKAQTPAETHAVVQLDPSLDKIISPNAKLELVKSGFGFTEGLTWVRHGKTGYLLFSDIPADVIDKLTPDGKLSVFLRHSGYDGPWNGYEALRVGHRMNNGKNPKDPLFREFMLIGSDGLTLDPQGRLVICTFAGRSLERMDKDGRIVLLADRYDGKRFNGPNDVVVKRDGAIYFTDTFSWQLKDKDPSTELHHEGIYMLKNGKVTWVIRDIPTPNGLAFSPHQRYLYANGNYADYIRRYDVQPDDTVTNGKLLIDMSADKAPGHPDGMKVDSKGNIYSSGPGGLWIISPQGKHLGTIRVPELFANLVFGGPDYRTLYIGGRTSIYKIRVKIPGNHY